MEARRKRPRPPGILAWVFLLALLPSCTSAQTLAGRLLDASAGTPIALGRVILADLEGKPAVYTVADVEGSFTLTAPEPGQYWVSAQSVFYWDFADGPVTLSASDTILVEFRLSPHPTQLEELVVEGERRPWRMVLGGYYDRERSGLGWYLD